MSDPRVEYSTPSEWRTLLQTMIGPDTWVQLNINGPIGDEELEFLNEYLKIIIRGYARTKNPQCTATPEADHD